MDGIGLPKLTIQSPQDLVQASFSPSGTGKTTPKDAALMFEGMMMTLMFQAMRKTVQPSGLFADDSQARSTYDYMLDQAVVEHVMTSGKGWGLAESLEKNWTSTKKDGAALS